MESDLTLKSEVNSKFYSVIQNISILESTLSNPNIESSESSNLIQNMHPIFKKLNEFSQESAFKDKQSSKEFICDDINEQDLKYFNVELEIVKHAINYLESNINLKDKEIQFNDQKIEKLEKIVSKQKRKLKDLNSRIQFQGSKIVKMQERIPKSSDLTEIRNFQESFAKERTEKIFKNSENVSTIESKTLKYQSTSPKMKSPKAGVNLLPKRIKK